MYRTSTLESGYDFITLYFEDAIQLREASRKLYKFAQRVNFEYMDLQRKDFLHKPGDIPHFHNGTEATKGPHLHVIYPHRPTQRDWDVLKEMCSSRLVGIELNIKDNEEIS